jgi:hypothetical protein
LNSGTTSSRPGFVDGTHHRLKMARFEQKDRSSVQFERQAAPCEIFRLVQPRGVGQASTMIFHVHAHVDDHMFEATAKTARDAFAKAIEWHVVGRLTGISISDGTRSYSIAEFASVMALAEIANIKASAKQYEANR